MRKSLFLKKQHIYLVILLVALGAAFYFRWRFIQTVHLYPDEFATLLAMDMIRQKGIPVLPSGLFYDHGILYSYTAAAAAYLGDAVLWGRVTSLMFGLTTIALVYALGRRWFSPPVGVLAAAGLALTPVAIQWSGRVRMYALLQFLVFLTIALTVEGLYYRRVKAGWLAALTYLAALLTQFAAVALLPPLALAEMIGLLTQQKDAAMERDERRSLLLSLVSRLRLLGRQFWLRMAALGGAALIAFLVKRAGQPKGIEPIAEANPVRGIWQVVQIYADVSFDIGQSWAALSPFFLQPPVLIFTVFAVVAVTSLFVPAVGGRRQALSTSATFSTGLLNELAVRGIAAFLSIILILTTLEMIFLVSADRRDDKYLFMLLPVLLLLGAYGMALVIGWVTELLGEKWRDRGEIIAVIGVCVLIGWYSHSQISALLADIGEDYESAFTHVAQNLQPGEAVLTGTPAAAYHYLRRNDYYAVQAGGLYDYRILPGPNGDPVERWLGSPWIQTPAELNAIFAEGPVWLILERWGLLIQYYDLFFMQDILAQTDFIREDNGVIVLKSRPNAKPLSESPAVVTDAILNGTEGDSGQLKLLGYTLEDNRLTLYWQAQTPVIFDYTVFVNVQNEAGETVLQADHRPLGSIYPTTLWPAGEIIRETSELALPPDAYRLRVGMYRLETGERLWVPSDDSLQNMAPLGELRITNDE